MFYCQCYCRSSAVVPVGRKDSDAGHLVAVIFPGTVLEKHTRLKIELGCIDPHDLRCGLSLQLGIGSLLDRQIPRQSKGYLGCGTATILAPTGRNQA